MSTVLQLPGTTRAKTKARTPTVKRAAVTALPNDRLRLALEVSWEIESLANLILTVNEDGVCGQMARRGLAMRIKQINSVAMSILGGDDSRATEEMGCVIRGRHVTSGRALAHD